MHERVPPSAEVAREQVIRTYSQVREALRPILPVIAHTARRFHEFVVAYERAEMRHAADTMASDPRETDNRLVDWLR